MQKINQRRACKREKINVFYNKLLQSIIQSHYSSGNYALFKVTYTKRKEKRIIFILKKKCNNFVLLETSTLFWIHTSSMGAF